MAGHSKWANTKNRKAEQDTKRDKIFTKITRELVTAARLSGGDTASNPRLKAVINKALSNNMTRDTLNRTIARGLGSNKHRNMESIIYEGYGPGGTAIMVECFSNNRNRTVSDIRHAFTKFGGNLGTYGSVSYLFTKHGVISYALGIDEYTLTEVALKAGAEYVKYYSDIAIGVYTSLEHCGKIKKKLSSAGFKANETEVIITPLTKASLDSESAPKLLRLIDVLKNLGDVQKVYHNGEISDDVMV